MRFQTTTAQGLLKVLLFVAIVSNLSLQDVSTTRVDARSFRFSIPSVGLVILLTALPNQISGRTLDNDREVLYDQAPTMVSSSSFEDTSASSNAPSSDEIQRQRKVTRGRISRQLSAIAPALQTMGCLPKFFCGMNSKAPSESSSTLNDLAYLIKFAMVDETDSDELRGKDDLNSDESSDEELTEGQKLRLENLADQDLIMDDPEYLSYMWKDMKSKLKTKLKDDKKKTDTDDLQELMAQLEAEEKTSFRLPSIFSGLSSLVRLGRSIPDHTRSNRSIADLWRRKSFWNTREFDEQMKLAARIGVQSSSDQKCGSTFNLCPYTITQMKDMVRGKLDNPSAQMQWYLNSDGPKPEPKVKTTTRPPRTTRAPAIAPSVKPNTISHLIHAFNPNSLDGRKPVKKIVPTTTRKPIRKPYLAVKPEPEDDEDENLPVNLQLPSNVKIIKLTQQEQEKQQHQAETESLEKIINGFETSSEEENKVKLKVPKGSNKIINSTIKVKRPIGLPRPKYSIKNKDDPQPQTKKKPTHSGNKETNDDDESPEEDEESSQEKEEDEEETSSEEKDPDLKNKKPESSTQSTKLQTQNRFKQDTEESDESKESDDTKISNSNKEKPDGQKGSDDESKQEISSEEKRSSEEADTDKPDAPQNSVSTNNKGNSKRWPSTKSQHSHPEYSEDSEETEYSEEKHPAKKETLRPINYSYFNGKPRPTQPLPEQSPQNTGFNQQQRPGKHPDGQNIQNQRPTPKPAKGFFSSLFGKGKKPLPNRRPQGRPPLPTEMQQNKNPQESRFPRPQNRYPPSNDGPTNQDARNDEETNDDVNSDEKPTQPDSQPSPPLPPVYGSNPNPSHDRPPQLQTGNRPGQPPRIPQYHTGNPNRPQPPRNNQINKIRNPQQTQNMNRQPPTNHDNEDNNLSKEDDKSDEDSESKEDDKKSEESKESEETDGTRIKNMFSKSAIATLGSNHYKGDQYHNPPPLPPIANWRPTEETTTALPVTSNPLPYEPVFPGKPKIQNTEKIVPQAPKDEYSNEYLEVGKDPEDQTAEDISDEPSSSEEVKKPKNKNNNKKKKFEDDEAEHREPPRKSFNERLPELGEVVSTSSKEESSDVNVPLPPISSFPNNKNEINIPVTGKPENIPPKFASPSRRPPTRNPDNTKNGNPGPMSPMGIRGPGSGMMMRPNGGNNNNRRPGNNNNRMPGNNNAQESSEENGSSEETIGGSSEENESDDKRGRTSINTKQLSNAKNRQNKTTPKPKVSKPTSEKPQQDFKNELKAKLEKQTEPQKPKPFIQSPIRIASLGQSLANDPSNKFSANTPPLPPIFRWKSQPSPTTKPKPRKPMVKPSSRFTKPLSPKMVQYLRETYGNAVRIPDRVTTPGAAASKIQNDSKPKHRRRPAIYGNGHLEDDELRKPGQKSSEEIDFDEFHHVGDSIGGNGKFSRRQGGGSDSKTSTTSKPKLKLPPIYGKQKKRRGH